VISGTLSPVSSLCASRTALSAAHNAVGSAKNRSRKISVKNSASHWKYFHRTLTLRNRSGPLLIGSSEWRKKAA
jgi:hypothetical protein